MHCHDSLWCVFPMVCFGMMLLFSVVYARRGRRAWCFSPRRKSDAGAHIEKLEGEIQSLKQELAKVRMEKKD